MKSHDDVWHWRSNSDSVPCKKGGLLVICKNCGEQKHHRHLIGFINDFLHCPRCDCHEFHIFRTTESILDYCDRCDEDCKIPDYRKENRYALMKYAPQCVGPF